MDDDKDIHGGNMSNGSNGSNGGYGNGVPRLNTPVPNGGETTKVRDIYKNGAELSDGELRSFGTKGNSDGFRVTNGSSNDAMIFVRSQTQGLSEYAPGKHVGYNSRGVEFRIYDRVGYGYTSIRISGSKV